MILKHFLRTLRFLSRDLITELLTDVLIWVLSRFPFLTLLVFLVLQLMYIFAYCLLSVFKHFTWMPVMFSSFCFPTISCCGIFLT